MSEDAKKAGTDSATKPADATTPAERALAEADERRRQADTGDRPTKEIGREGPDPARYGDWEKKGIASDF